MTVRQKYTVALTAIGVVSSLIIIASLWHKFKLPPKDANRQNVVASPKLNVRLELPDGWEFEIAPAEFEAAYLFRHANPEVSAVLAVRDVKSRILPNLEMRQEAERRLGKLLKGAAIDAPTDATIAGQSAQRFVAQGDRGGIQTSAELYVLQHQGYACWFLLWCPSDQVTQAAGHLAALRGSLIWLNARPDWKPQSTVFTGTIHADTLRDDTGRWIKAKLAASEFDPQADLALEAQEPGTTTADHRAMILVIHLPTGPQTVQAAQDKLVTREHDVYPETKLEELASVAGSEVKLRGYRVINSPARQRFVLIRLVPRSDGTAMVLAECDAARRAAWEDEFRKMLESFQVTSAIQSP